MTTVIRVLQPLCVLHVLPLEVAPEFLQGEVARGLGDVPIVTGIAASRRLFADKGDDVGARLSASLRLHEISSYMVE